MPNAGVDECGWPSRNPSSREEYAAPKQGALPGRCRLHIEAYYSLIIGPGLRGLSFVCSYGSLFGALIFIFLHLFLSPFVQEEGESWVWHSPTFIDAWIPSCGLMILLGPFATDSHSCHRLGHIGSIPGCDEISVIDPRMAILGHASSTPGSFCNQCNPHQSDGCNGYSRLYLRCFGL